MSLNETMTYVRPDGTAKDESNYASNNSNTSYGDFAATMNNNYSIDMGEVIQNLSNSAMQSINDSLKNADLSGIDLTGVVPDTDSVSAGNAVGSVGESDETSGTNGVSTESSATAQPIVGVPSWSGAMGSYDEWMTEQGYDPDGDYDNAKAALEYDYETSMATYGRKAEELWQMGLSNSGLSDIYQLGAYNSYIQAQNDLANQRIAAKKKYKQEYNALLKENEAAFKTDSANAYNLGLSIYDGNNADFVRQQLTNQGYDASVIDQVMSSLSSLDVATLPTVKAQAEKAEAEMKQHEADINSAVNSLANSYDIDKEAGIRQLYSDWANIDLGNGKTKLDVLIEKLNGYAAAFAPSEEEMINAWIASYDASAYTGSEADKTAIRQKLRGTEYEKYADKIIAQLDADRKDTMKANAADLMTALDSENDVAFENAYSLVGVSKDTWDSMEDEDKTLMLLSAVGDMVREGYITQEDGAKTVNEWYDATVKEIQDIEQGERPEKIDQLMDQIDTLAESGVINEETRKACKEQLQSWKNEVVDANIRGAIHTIGQNNLYMMGASALGLPGMLLAGGHNIGSAIVRGIKGEKQAWQ